ncbi:oxysterol-binding protein-related protein 8 [Hyalella azteca]|uniref:Oxysterol-binding protein-related protein 8 n=1 Tax=Hyalella azteca TaxID=294128 RepID=A0A8B7N5T4_HYAAZ|nr:oxysterol-binding protein-related protein 8 [Hyalella azteca]
MQLSNRASDSSQPAMSLGSTADNSTLSRAESYKDQRRKYRHEKKRVAQELLSTLKDPSVVVLAEWLKVRGTLKGWTKLWCVLKPGMLLLYKSSKAKSGHWCGTVLLNTCEIIERPSKKDGFCFKLFHPLEQSIWATRGPQGESIGAVVQPLPSSHLIFRAPSQAAGKCWMDAMELAVRCSSILLRSMATTPGRDAPDALTTAHWNEADFEKHFMDQAVPVMPVPVAFLRRVVAADLDDASHTDEKERSSCGHGTDTDSDDNTTVAATTTTTTNDNNSSSGVPKPQQQQQRPPHRPRRRLQRPSDASGQAVEDPARRLRGNSSVSSEQPGDDEDEEYEDDEEDVLEDDDDEEEEEEEHVETSYIENHEEFVCEGGGGQQEELGEENKSLIWCLVKQVRPGMDLSRVVLPTFILEPRSFLDKLSDYYYHADILSRAVQEDDPFDRMKEVVRWYLSGFYKKPKGLKKPYNPILGETFRCYWRHPNGSRTFYVAEQERRLPRFTVTPEQQGPMESERLWLLVSQAIRNDDQVAATEEKSLLEEVQRSDVRERKAKCEEWQPKYFTQDPLTGAYVYNYADLRPWDPRTDLHQYEYEYRISTKTRHKHLKEGRSSAPCVSGSQATSLTASIISMDPKCLMMEPGPRLMGVTEGVESPTTDLSDPLIPTPLVMATSSAGGHTTAAADLNAVSCVSSALERLESTQVRLLQEVQKLRQQMDGVNSSLGSQRLSPPSRMPWTHLLGVLVFSFLCQLILTKISRPL